MTTLHFINHGKPEPLDIPLLYLIQITKTTHTFTFMAFWHFYFIFKLIERKQDSVYEVENMIVL